jgi:hypothetical protein
VAAIAEFHLRAVSGDDLLIHTQLAVHNMKNSQLVNETSSQVVASGMEGHTA